MEQEIILEARNITKVYPGGVVANHNVNLQIKKGEIHALVGENGAGKSTLMKMLFGMLAPTEGQIFVDGKEVHFSSSSDAIAAGLGMVHQHFMQVPSMTVAENLILGAETGSPFKVDRKKAVEITKELSEKYNLKVEAEDKVEDISLAMRQKLEILKALYRGAHILILDEPTAVLTPQETEELFEQLMLLRESGHTIIFISHKLNEVKALCNRMTILRDGKTIDLTAKEYDLIELLMKNPRRVYSRESLMDLVWGYSYAGDYRTVDVHIRRLREKLEPDPANPVYIMTKWGVGYYFKGEEQPTV